MEEEQDRARLRPVVPRRYEHDRAPPPLVACGLSNRNRRSPSPSVSGTPTRAVSPHAIRRSYPLTVTRRDTVCSPDDRGTRSGPGSDAATGAPSTATTPRPAQGGSSRTRPPGSPCKCQRSSTPPGARGSSSALQAVLLPSIETSACSPPWTPRRASSPRSPARAARAGANASATANGTTHPFVARSPSFCHWPALCTSGR